MVEEATTGRTAMQKLDELCAAWAPRLISVLRFVAALVILQYALTKLFGFPYFEGLSNQPAFTLYWFTGVIELVFGGLTLIGLFTRFATFILSGEMAFAYFIEHAPHSFFPLLNEGNEAVLFCFIFLFLAAAGGGPWSLDALLRSNRK
jgi:putative oxidoreductase